MLTALVEPVMNVRSPGDGVVALVLFTALALVTVAAALRFAAGRGDGAVGVLLLACLGSMLAVFNEPIFDLLGKIYYPANNSPTYFTAFDRPIPAFLLAGYMPFVGVLPFVLAEKIRDGVSRRALCLFAFGSFLGVVLVESLGTGTDSWVYYGEAPMKWLGVAPQMAAVPLVAAALLLVLTPHLRGAQRLALVFVGPVSLAAVYAGAGWPMYVALYSDWPVSGDVLASVTTLALVAGIVWALATAVTRTRVPTLSVPPTAAAVPTEEKIHA
jgi:hypothetical protein